MGRIFCCLGVAVYIPFEAMGVLRGGGALDWCSLALNRAIFVWRALQLRRGRTLRRREADAPRSSGGAES